MNELAGRWFDGRSSRARDVRVTKSGDALLLTAEDGSTHAWPLGEVTLGPRLGSTPRSLRRGGHGHVECPDSPLLDAWFPRPSSRIEAFADFLERRRAAIAVAAIVVVLASVGFVHSGLPWVANALAKRMPPAVERHVSNQVIAVLERLHLGPSSIPIRRRQALESRFAAMVAGEPRAADMRIRFVSGGGLGANAFALPDGRIFVTDELVGLLESDEEILAVLAHEAGHHVHRHGTRQAIESSSVFLVAGLVFGDVSGSSLAVSIPAVLLESGFSRGHEREADAYALELLKRKRLPVGAFGAALHRLAKARREEEGGGEGALGYLSTHPATRERIEQAEQAASTTR